MLTDSIVTTTVSPSTPSDDGDTISDKDEAMIPAIIASIIAAIFLIVLTMVICSKSCNALCLSMQSSYPPYTACYYCNRSTRMDFFDFRIDSPYNNKMQLLRMSQMRMANNDLYMYGLTYFIVCLLIYSVILLGVTTVKKTLRL